MTKKKEITALKVPWRYKKRKLLYYGCDQIRAMIEPGDFNLFNLSNNSNQVWFKFLNYDLSISFIPWATKEYEYYYIINYEGINIAFITLMNSQGNSYLEITGQGLTIFWIYIFYHIMKYFWFEFIKFKRLDFCFDLEIDINYFYKKILPDKYKIFDENEKCELKRIHSSKKNWIETIYLNDRSKKKNTYIVNRIYNKKLDSVIKWKEFLYKWIYDNCENVMRLETELREDIACFWAYESLKDSDLIFYRLVKSFYKLNTQFFKFLKIDDFREIEKKIKLKNKWSIQRIKNWEDLKPSTAYQAKVKKIITEKKHQDKYWHEFLFDHQRDYWVNNFNNCCKKLLANWYTKEKLFEIIENNNGLIEPK